MWAKLQSVMLISLLATNAWSYQVHVKDESFSTASDNLEVVPLGLDSITDSFTALKHPSFPSHQVRIKLTNFCDPTVKVWTGIIRLNDLLWSLTPARLHRC